MAALADFIAPYSPYEIFTAFCQRLIPRSPVRHRRQGPRRSVAHDVRRTLLADHRPGCYRCSRWSAAPSSALSPPSCASACRERHHAHPRRHHVLPRHRAGRHVRRGVRQLRAFAHLRDRLLVHPADRAYRARQRHERVQPGLRARSRRLRRPRPVDPREARHAQLRGSRSWCSPSCSWPTPSCSRPPWPSSRPASPSPRPTWGNILSDARNGVLAGPLVAGAVPRPVHHDHRAVPEHPVRGHHRRHGRAPKAPSRSTRTT